MKYDCPECEREFDTPQALIAHGQVHTRNKKQPSTAIAVRSKFTCEKCDKGFKNAHGLHIHMIRMHKKPIKKTVIQPARQEKTPVQIMFCPCCGYNLKVLQHALTLIGGMQDGNS